MLTKQVSIVKMRRINPKNKHVVRWKIQLESTYDQFDFMINLMKYSRQSAGRINGLKQRFGFLQNGRKPSPESILSKMRRVWILHPIYLRARISSYQKREILQCNGKCV